MVTICSSLDCREEEKMSLSRVFARSSLLQRSARLVRGGAGGGGRMIPFARLAPPSEKVRTHYLTHSLTTTHFSVFTE